MRTLIVRLSRTFAALRHPDYRRLWFGLLISNTGAWMQITAQGWLVFQLTNSALYLGLVGACTAIPRLAFSLVGGTVADRMDRRVLLLITQVAQGTLALLLGLLTLTGLVTVWQILVIVVVANLALSFEQPARQAMTPDIVARADLPNAIALNALAFNGAAVVGPSLAGGLIPTIGTAGCFLANGISFGAVVVALLGMKVPGASPPSPERPALVRDLVAGLRYASMRPLFVHLLLLVAVTSFFARPYVYLMPVFARDILAVGAPGLGLLLTAPGAGTLAGAFLLAAVGGMRRQAMIALASAGAFGITLVIFALSRTLALSAGALVVAGACQTTALSSIQTVLQTRVDDWARGRILGMYTMLTLGLVPLGALPAGALAQAIGAPLTVALGGALTTLLTATLRAARGTGIRGETLERVLPPHPPP